MAAVERSINYCSSENICCQYAVDWLWVVQILSTVSAICLVSSVVLRDTHHTLCYFYMTSCTVLCDTHHTLCYLYRAKTLWLLVAEILSSRAGVKEVGYTEKLAEQQYIMWTYPDVCITDYARYKLGVSREISLWKTYPLYCLFCMSYNYIIC